MKFHHTTPIGSLKKVGEREGIYRILEWNSPVIIQPKIDGINITLRYKDGRLTGAGTSGDGNIGRDVTHHFLHCKVDNVQNGDVTGESFIRGVCRATTAGIINRKERSELSNKLEFIPHEDIPFLALGLPMKQLHKDIKSALQRYSNMEYETDGIVIKVACHKKREVLGYGRLHVPNWAIAIKFPTQVYETKVIEIEYTIGDTGRVTPIAHIEPVVVKQGYTISKVNCYSEVWLKKNDIKPNDTVYVTYKYGTTPTIVPKG